MEWNQLILNYELTENDWLRDLYQRREKWIPAYLRTMFCAGMSTTQRSESMNNFFKDFVHSSMLVSDFVYQYEKALDKRYQSEKEKDVKTRTTKAILKTCYKMEVQAAEVYTRRIFSFFQKELFLSQNQSVSKFYEGGTTKTYNVVADGKENLVYEVVFDILEKKAVCSCHKFEFVGILCRHILALFAKKSLASHLPEYYILRRWTINAKSHVANEISPTLMSQVTLQEGSKGSSTFTKHNLMIEVSKVVEEGQKSQKKHDHLAIALQKLHCELRAMEDDDEIDIEDDLESSPPLEGGTELLSNITFTLHDPPHVASRGRPKSLRQKHPKENHMGKKRKCSICKQPGHTRTTCHIQKQVGDNVGGTSSSPSVLIVSTNQNLHEANLDFHNPISMSQDPKCSTFMDLMMEAPYTSLF
ncbi:protein FAR1-RELATED SEQUENCE 5-like [Rhododendron vialii]|uniref:protein FAR1-RELATED SEQUENCE 5-like n=1 Tax=Rhododendron vialii TaxID=182163 RepID=UPI002660318A|nr:protein FAR1-RELATED SEQUENCE 5-like [Rhododendron vialii]